MTKEKTVRNAMRRALESLEMSHELADTGYTDFKKYGLAIDEDITEKLSTAITALREALNASLAEQPTTQPLVVPDLLTTLDPETPEYRNGWNDCRQLMMEMYRREIK